MFRSSVSHDDAVADAGSLVLVLASPADAAEPLLSEDFDPLLLLLSSFSVLLSTSIGSSFLISIFGLE
jgi:hypothetical protein